MGQFHVQDQAITILDQQGERIKPELNRMAFFRGR